MILKETSTKKVAIVVAFVDFKDEECFIPKEILEKAGFKVDVVSNNLGIAHGAAGGELKVDFVIDQFKVDDYQAIIFIGGPGCLKNLDNQFSYQVAQEAVSQNKILAAICISPVILAKAGILEGRKATVWSSTLDKSPVKTLQENGAIYQDEKVVVDGNIITANGPAAAQAFGQKIIETLKD